MGLSFHVEGLRAADEHHAKMVAALHACQAARVELPVAVAMYFAECDRYLDGVRDTDRALVVSLGDALTTSDGGELDDYGDCEDCVVDLAKLPAGVVKLRMTFTC